MAKGDLYRLAVDAQEFLKQDATIYREFYTDTLVHVFSASYEQVKTQAYKQIGTKFTELSTNTKNNISRAVATYVAELYDAFRLTKVTSADVTIEGTARSFSATITQVGKTTPFQIINNIKREPQKDLVNRLNTILVPHETGHHNFSSDNFLDTGHVTGVADRYIDDALTPVYNAARRSKELSGLVANSLRLKIASKFLGSSKIFTIEVTEESAQSNRSKASDEKARLAKTRTRLSSFISRNVNWATQEGSDSKIEFIEKQLIAEFAKTKGYRGPKPVKSDTKPANAEKIVQSKAKTSKSSDSVSIPIKPARSNINLVALLNAKVSDEIRKRMTYPRLQYRSGRFADSVQVIAASKGLITYKYQRSPYQVFESGVGKSPWNTPERDPRTLIDESIRAAAIGIMSSRFNTRRV